MSLHRTSVVDQTLAEIEPTLADSDHDSANLHRIPSGIGPHRANVGLMRAANWTESDQIWGDFDCHQQVSQNWSDDRFGPEVDRCGPNLARNRPARDQCWITFERVAKFGPEFTKFGSTPTETLPIMRHVGVISAKRATPVCGTRYTPER